MINALHGREEHSIQWAENQLCTKNYTRQWGLKREAYMVWKMFDPYELTGLFWDGMSYALGSFLEEAGGGGGAW